MKIKYLFVATIAVAWATSAQAQVKIGENPGIINAGSVLEIESTNKGVLLPRVALTNTTTWGLAGTPAAGMQVYNNAAGITTSNASYPITTGGVGVYYWDGTGWVATKYVANAASLEPWFNVATNAGATANTQNIYQMGNVGVGTITPASKLTVAGDITTYAQASQILINGATNGNYQLSLGYNITANKGYIQAAESGTAWRDLILQPNGANVGIGALTPGNKLEINQGAAGNSGLRFTQMNNSTPPTITNVAPIGVNANGDVVRLPLGSLSSNTEYATVQNTTVGVPTTYIKNDPPVAISNSNMTLTLTTVRTVLVAFNYGFDEISAAIGGGFGNGAITKIEIYMDGAPTGYCIVGQIVRDGGGQLSVSGIIPNVAAGAHTFDVRLSIPSSSNLNSYQQKYSINGYAYGL